MPLNHLGEEYVRVTVWQDGVKCRFCRRTIRVREDAARFERYETHTGTPVPVVDYECAECVTDSVRMARSQKGGTS